MEPSRPGSAKPRACDCEDIHERRAFHTAAPTRFRTTPGSVRLREAAGFAGGDVPDLGHPTDCVSECLPQRARLDLQLFPGLRVVATGIAVDGPHALAAPGQARLEPALRDVCRPAEPGKKPGREGGKSDAPAAEL